MNCPKCGSEQADGARFCNQCGGSLARTPDAPPVPPLSEAPAFLTPKPKAVLIPALAVVAALLALAALLMAAVWLFYKAKPSDVALTAATSPLETATSPTATQTTSYADRKPRLVLPKFEHEILTSADIGTFSDFMAKNLGHLVYVNTKLSDKLSDVVETFDGNSELSLPSIDFHLLIKGKDHELGWYLGQHVLNGFFVISPNVEEHQGICYSMESVNRAQVLIELQKSN